MATLVIPKVGPVALVMTDAESLGLKALVREGAEGLLNDATAAKGYIGGAAAVAAARRAAIALGAHAGALKASAAIPKYVVIDSETLEELVYGAAWAQDYAKGEARRLQRGGNVSAAKHLRSSAAKWGKVAMRGRRVVATSTERKA